MEALETKMPRRNLRGISAVRTRLELATFGVTGRHSNQLNYRTRYAVLPSEASAKLHSFS